MQHAWRLSGKRSVSLIYVKLVTGKSVAIHTDFFGDILRLRLLATWAFGLRGALERVRIIFAGKLLEDKRCLAHYSIQKASTVHVVPEEEEEQAQQLSCLVAPCVAPELPADVWRLVFSHISWQQATRSRLHLVSKTFERLWRSSPHWEGVFARLLDTSLCERVHRAPGGPTCASACDLVPFWLGRLGGVQERSVVVVDLSARGATEATLHAALPEPCVLSAQGARFRLTWSFFRELWEEDAAPEDWKERWAEEREQLESRAQSTSARLAKGAKRALERMQEHAAHEGDFYRSRFNTYAASSLIIIVGDDAPDPSHLHAFAHVMRVTPSTLVCADIIERLHYEEVEDSFGKSLGYKRTKMA